MFVVRAGFCIKEGFCHFWRGGTSSSRAAGVASGARESLPADKPVVLLVDDDQAIVGEAVRRQLAGEEMEFHFCSAGSEAVEERRRGLGRR